MSGTGNTLNEMDSFNIGPYVLLTKSQRGSGVFLQNEAILKIK